MGKSRVQKYCEGVHFLAARMKRVSHQKLIPMTTLVKNRKQQYTFPAHVFKPAAYPSINSSSSWFTAWPSSWGNVVILLKDRLSCRSDGQVTAGSKVSRGPTQLRETFSMLSESRDSSSTGSDWSWLPWRSSRVRLFKFCQIKKQNSFSTEFFWSFYTLVIQHISEGLPGKELKVTPADSRG